MRPICLPSDWHARTTRNGPLSKVLSMSEPAKPDTDALQRAVETLILKNIALIGEHDEALAEAVRQTQGPALGMSRVVVVGETKRGKSSLVNALLRQPELSPVDLSVATSAFSSSAMAMFLPFGPMSEVARTL